MFSAKTHAILFNQPPLRVVSHLQNVVDFLGRRDSTLRETVDAERMALQILLPEALPSVVVAALRA